MAMRIKHELSRILIGIGLGFNFVMTITSSWHKDYSWAAIHAATTAVMFALTIQIERFELHINTLLEAAELKRRFALLMVEKLQNGSMEIEIQDAVNERENSNASKDK